MGFEWVQQYFKGFTFTLYHTLYDTNAIDSAYFYDLYLFPYIYSSYQQFNSSLSGVIIHARMVLRNALFSDTFSNKEYYRHTLFTVYLITLIVKSHVSK